MIVPTEMTPHAEKMLAAIRAAGGWLSHRHIATALGKNRLNPWELALLKLMDERGLIEGRQRPIAGRVRFRYEYRVRPQH